MIIKCTVRMGQYSRCTSKILFVKKVKRIPKNVNFNLDFSDTRIIKSSKVICSNLSFGDIRSCSGNYKGHRYSFSMVDVYLQVPDDTDISEFPESYIY